MSTPTHVEARGTKLLMGDGESPEQFTAIARITSFPLPNLTMDMEEVEPAHDDEDGFKMHIPGALDAGEFTIGIRFLPGNPTHNAQTGLLAAYLQRKLTNFKIEFTDPDKTVWAFAAYVSGFEGDAPVTNALTANVTLRPVGAPEFTSNA